MEADGLFRYLRKNQVEQLKPIREGSYKPNPLSRVEIPKDEPGKVRRLGISALADRVIQQAIAQVLTPIYEYAFSEFGYGFRPDRDCHMALKRLKSYADEGYICVVDMDLAKYSDAVNHSKLMQVLSVMIKDRKLLFLINKCLN